MIADDLFAGLRVLFLDAQDLGVVPGDDVVDLARDLPVNDVRAVPLRPYDPDLVGRAEVIGQDAQRGVDRISRPLEAVLFRDDEREIVLPGRVPVSFPLGCRPLDGYDSYVPGLGLDELDRHFRPGPRRQT